MNRHTIKRLAFVGIIIALAITAYTFTAFAAPDGKHQNDIISQALKGIGVEDGTITGFYSWTFGKIIDCMDDIDDALTDVTGQDHDMSGLFEDTIDSTFDEFDDVRSDEEAIDKLGEIIDEAAN